MPVKLRLQRQGRTHRPFYHIVAADSRAPRDGNFLEKIGTYDPVTQPTKVILNHESALKWLRNGAQPTETVRSLFSHQGIMLKLHLLRKGKTAEEVETTYKTWLEEKSRKNAEAASQLRREEEKTKSQKMEAEKAKRAAIEAKVAAKLKPAEEAAPAAEEAVEAAPEVAVEAAAEVAVEAAAEEVVEAAAEEVVEAAAEAAAVPAEDTPAKEAPAA